MRTQPTIHAIRAVNASVPVKFFEADLSILSSVRQAAHAILADKSIPVIDVIVNNAAVMACPFELTAEGNEMQLAAGYLGHFVLTNRLMPKLQASTTQPRVINLSSTSNKAGGIRWADPNFSEAGAYKPFSAYAQTKTANILFSVALNQRYHGQGDGFRSFALHPGSISTNLQKFMTSELREEAIQQVFGTSVPDHSLTRKTLQQGCSTTLRAALDPTLDIQGEGGNGGVFLSDCQPTIDPDCIAPWALDAASAQRFWAWSEGLVGEKFSQ